MSLILSIFPGIDMFGKAFEAEGFCIVRGPDILWGGDIRSFHPPPGKFDGVIGGSPCQDFSKARRAPPTGYGLEMLGEFERVVTEAWPAWWLLENVPGVPDVSIPGYTVQRLDLNARECGLSQRRLRHFQFGSNQGHVIIPNRELVNHTPPTSTCLASEFSQNNRRDWPDFCEAQGLPRNFTLHGMARGQSYRAVGNGVPIPMGRVMAAAVRDRVEAGSVSLCACRCGRVVTGKQESAGPACRKRLQRERERDASSVTIPEIVTPG